MKKFWKNKKVLVVGGAGFIGSHTVDALLKYGAKVVIVDNLSNGKKENCSPHARFYRLDAASTKIAAVFDRERPDYVYLFAALVNVPLGLKHPSHDAKSIIALVNVLENCVQYGVKKVLYSSSGFIYGNAVRRPTSESAPLQPLSPYSISKAAGESYLKFFHSYYGLPYVILRYGTVYGSRQVSGAVADYIRKICRNERAEIYGTKTRDYVHVADVVAANIAAMRANIGGHEAVFNIATGKETHLAKLYAMIARVLGKPGNKPVLRPARSGEIDRFCLDTRKAKKMIRFSPRVPLERGLAETIRWFLKNQK
ncbi:MAG: NAD-dependent epimerase/dehydratase family protein [Candidatus Sungiibacteriota bacterium]